MLQSKWFAYLGGPNEKLFPCIKIVDNKISTNLCDLGKYCLYVGNLSY